MEAHTETPPEGLWSDIERAMDRRAEASSKRRRTLLWSLCTGAAAAVAALLLFLNTEITTTPGTTSEVASVTTTASELPGDETNLEADRIAALDPATGSESAPAPVHFPETVTTREHVRPNGSTPRVEPASIPEQTEVFGSAFLTEPATIPESETDPETTLTPETIPGDNDSSDGPSTGRPATGDERVMRFDDYLDIYIPKPKKRRWQAALYAANISSGTSGNSSVEYSLDATSIGLNSGFTDNSRTVYTDVRHRLPFTVGISVGRDLSEKWSLTSGVTYTRLSSRFLVIDRGRQSSEQVLHNIGIPLSVSYNLWQGKRLSFYLSAGGRVEKSVSGTIVHSYTSGNNAALKRREPVSDRVQWSVGGAIGVQYDFVKIAGLYAEPGVSYYFDNGSDTETIYKAKPFNFGFQLGLRFSL